MYGEFAGGIPDIKALQERMLKRYPNAVHISTEITQRCNFARPVVMQRNEIAVKHSIAARGIEDEILL